MNQAEYAMMVDEVRREADKIAKDLAESSGIEINTEKEFLEEFVSKGHTPAGPLYPDHINPSAWTEEGGHHGPECSTCGYHRCIRCWVIDDAMAGNPLDIPECNGGG